MAEFNWMSSPAALAADRPLDVQSRGRELSDGEQRFAAALEEIFSQGCHNWAQVADSLNERQIASPGGGDIHWSVETLEAELTALNAQLDLAFAEHGYGA